MTSLCDPCYDRHSARARGRADSLDAGGGRGPAPQDLPPYSTSPSGRLAS